MNEKMPTSVVDLLDYGPEAVPSAQAIVAAEIQQGVVQAIEKPRHWSTERVVEYQKMLVDVATANMELAQSCGYVLERKGKDGKPVYITGPSVVFTDMAAQLYGNCRLISAKSEIGKDFVTARAYFLDYETNYLRGEEVSMSIVTSSGRRYGNDMIQNVVQAAQAKAARNATLHGIGKWRLMPAYRRVMLFAKGRPEQLPELRRACDEYIVRELGIPRTRMLAVVNAETLDDLSLDDVLHLRKLAMAIVDGEASAKHAFPVVAKSQTAKLREMAETDVLKQAVIARRTQEDSDAGDQVESD